MKSIGDPLPNVVRKENSCVDHVTETERKRGLTRSPTALRLLLPRLLLVPLPGIFSSFLALQPRMRPKQAGGNRAPGSVALADPDHGLRIGTFPEPQGFRPRGLTGQIAGRPGVRAGEPAHWIAVDTPWGVSLSLVARG